MGDQADRALKVDAERTLLQLTLVPPPKNVPSVVTSLRGHTEAISSIPSFVSPSYLRGTRWPRGEGVLGTKHPLIRGKARTELNGPAQNAVQRTTYARKSVSIASSRKVPGRLGGNVLPQGEICHLLVRAAVNIDRNSLRKAHPRSNPGYNATCMPVQMRIKEDNNVTCMLVQIRTTEHIFHEKIIYKPCLIRTVIFQYQMYLLSQRPLEKNMFYLKIPVVRDMRGSTEHKVTMEFITVFITHSYLLRGRGRNHFRVSFFAQGTEIWCPWLSFIVLDAYLTDLCDVC